VLGWVLRSAGQSLLLLNSSPIFMQKCNETSECARVLATSGILKVRLVVLAWPVLNVARGC
jgi:hypothetical protein